MSGGDRRAQFGVLGPLRIHRGTDVVVLPGPGIRLLLGVLLLVPGEPVEQERLVELLWGPERGSAAALHTAVSRLRGWLRVCMAGFATIEHNFDGYRVCTERTLVDAARFRDVLSRAAGGRAGSRIETLSEALSMWRGRVLGNAAEWLHQDPTIAALERERIDAVRELADLCLLEGQPEAAVRHLRQVTEVHPFDEPLHALLVDALTASGRPSEAMLAYGEVRDRLAAELGVTPSATLRQAVARAGTVEPAPERQARPAELPPDVALFTGRDTEVALLSDLLCPAFGEQVRIVAIDGMAGVGKSALAAHVAHRVARRFPDGQLYVNLQGAEAGMAPLAPTDVLGRWLRQFGAPGAQLPRQIEDASARWRSVLAGKRVLLLLDNASSAEQVRPLLPAHGGCAAVITSRPVLSTLDQSSFVHLRPLAEVEALTLFRRLAGNERLSADQASVGRIAALCECLPLLLRIVAARLRARPDWPIDAVAARLADPRQRLDELQIGHLSARASLAVGLSGAGPDAKRAFALLTAIAVSEPDLPLMAALTGLSLPAAGAAMERLVDARLVESPRPGLYHMHDLVRLYARERAGIDLDADEPVAARRRALDHYLALAGQASALLDVAGAAAVEPGRVVQQPAGFRFADRPAAVSWVDANAPILPAVMTELAAEPDRAADVVRFALAVNSALAVRDHWLELVRLNQVAVTAAVDIGDRQLQAHARGLLGVAYRQTNRPGKSRAELTTALRIWTEFDDERRMAETLNNLGILARQQDNPAEAIRCHQRSIELCRRAAEAFGEVGDQYRLGVALGELAQAVRLAGLPDQSIHLYAESLRAIRQSGNRHGEAVQLWGFGDALHRSGRLDDARAKWRAALRILRDLGDMTDGDIARVMAKPVPDPPGPIRLGY